MSSERERAWQPTAQGHPNRWRILTVLILSMVIVVLDTTILNIALPTIQRDLRATPGELVWAVASYVLVFASMLFTWGVLGDRYGRKRVLLLGLVVFALASGACAFAPNPQVLIGFRALMGVGAAAVLPTTLAIITVIFPAAERGRAIGIWAGGVGAAVALGPVLGGLLLQHPQWTSWLTGNDWGSVFLINVPICIIAVIAGMRTVPPTCNPNPGRLDPLGLVVSIVGLFLLVFGIVHASETMDWLAPGVLIPTLSGVAILAGFLVYESRSDHPSFDVRLFRNRAFSVSLIAVTLAFFALSGITFTLPFYLQTLRGLDTLQAGLCFLPFAVGQLLAAPRSAATVARFGNRLVIAGGLSLVAVSMLLLAFMSMDTPLWLLLLLFFCFGFGMGNTVAPGSTVMQNTLPLSQAGAGSAVQNTVRQVGGALGVAIAGTVLATQYAARAAESLAQLSAAVPQALKDAAAESIVATDALLTEAVARGLSPEVADQVRAAVNVDFLDASRIISLLCAAVVLVAAVIVALRLPTVTPPVSVTHIEPVH